MRKSSQAKTIIYQSEALGYGNHPMAITSAQIRRINARRLAASSNSPYPQVAFAKKMEMSDSQVSQLIGINPSRNIGGIIARRIEHQYGLESGELDHLESTETLSEDEQEALSIYRLIGPGYRNAWLSSVKSFLGNLPTVLHPTKDVGMLQTGLTPQKEHEEVSLLNQILVLAHKHGFNEIVRGLRDSQGQAEQPRGSKAVESAAKRSKRKHVAAK